MKELSLPVHVNAASPLLVVSVAPVGSCGKVQVLVVRHWLSGFDAGPTDGRDQEATDGKGGVTDHLGREPVP